MKPIPTRWPVAPQPTVKDPFHFCTRKWFSKIITHLQRHLDRFIRGKLVATGEAHLEGAGLVFVHVDIMTLVAHLNDMPSADALGQLDFHIKGADRAHRHFTIVENMPTRIPCLYRKLKAPWCLQCSAGPFANMSLEPDHVARLIN